MNRIRLLPVLSVLLLPACQQLADLKAAADRTKTPTAKVVGVHLTDLSLEAITLSFDVEVKNPYSFPLPVAKLEYSIASGGAPFLSGRSEEQGLVPAMGTGELPLSVRVGFAEALATAKSVRPGEALPYEAELGLFLDGGALGTLHVPVRHEGEVPVPAVPDVSLAGIRWEGASLEEVRATLTLDIVNTNRFPVDLSEVGANLTLAGTDVGGVRLAKAASFEAGGKRSLEIPLSFSPKKLGLSALSLVTDREASYRMDGILRGSTPFGDIEFPFERKGEAKSRKK